MVFSGLPMSTVPSTPEVVPNSENGEGAVVDVVALVVVLEPGGVSGVGGTGTVAVVVTGAGSR